MRTNRLNIGPRACFRYLTGVIGIGLFFACLYILGNQPLEAASGLYDKVNYQGRLLTNTGAVVPDGTYNMRFKIYQDGDGVLGGGDETLEWTEQRDSGNKVLVKNGYFSVYLGSVSAFGSSVDWNQDTLWLSVEIGGTGAPGWDGEMSPFTRFSSTPYAMNSKYLSGLAVTDLVQLAQGTQTDASTTNASISINKTVGTASILDLMRGGSSVVNVANNGATTFKNQANSTTAFQIQNTAGEQLFNIDTSSTSNLITNSNFESNTTGWAAKGSSTISQTTSQKFLGNGSMSIANTAAANDGAKYNYSLASQTTYTLTFYAKSSSNTVAVSTINTGRTEDGATDSDCATGQTINAAGWTKVSCVFTTGNVTGTNHIYIKQTDATARTIYVDSVELQTSSNLISNPDFETDRSGWTEYSLSTLSQTGTQYYSGTGSMQATTSSFTGSLEGATSSVSISPSTTYNVSLWVQLDAGAAGAKTFWLYKRFDSTDSGSGVAYASVSLSPGVWTNITANITTSSVIHANPFIGILTTDSGDFVTQDTFYVDNVSVSAIKYDTNDIGRIMLNGIIDSPVVIQGQTSTNALQVQSASGSIALKVDTLNGRVGIGTNSPTASLHVQGKTYIQDTSSNTDTFFIEGSTGLDALKVGANTRVVTIGDSTYTGSNGQLNIYGTGLIKNQVNTGTGFRVQNASSVNIFGVDTSNSRLFSGIADGASSTGFALNTTNAYSTSGAKLLSLQNATTEKFSVDKDGNTDIASGAAYKINGTSICTSSGCVVDPTSGIKNQTTAQTSANFNIQSSADGSITGVLQARASQTADLLQAQNSSGVKLSGIGPDGSFRANSVATGTTGTTTGTGTSTTTLTLTADAFSVNDVVLIDNSGQDYYTRITVDPGTGSYTVSPAVSFEDSVTVTKYNIQNIGASSTDYSTNADRFFQGYFLGGVVTGAGSTSLSDGSLQSSNDMKYQANTHIFSGPDGSGTYLSVQNYSKEKIFSVDASFDPTYSFIPNGGFEDSDMAGTYWEALGTSSILSDYIAHTGDYGGRVNLGTVAGNGIKWVEGGSYLYNGGNFVFSFYARSNVGFSTMEFGYAEDGSTETPCKTAQTVYADGWYKYRCLINPTAISGVPYVYIKQTDSNVSGRVLYIDSVILGDTNTTAPDAIYGPGSLRVGATISSPIVVKNSSDSSGALTVQNFDASTAINLSTIGITNHLANTDFEVNTNGWSVLTSATKSLSEEPYFGGSSMQVDTAASAGSGVRSTSTTLLVGGRQYSFSFYAKAEASAFSAMEFGYTTNGSTHTACDTNQTVSAAGWTKYSCIFTMPTNATSSQFVYIKQTDATARTFYVDAVILAVVPTEVLNNSFTDNEVSRWTAKGAATLSRSTSNYKTSPGSMLIATTSAVGDGASYDYTFKPNTTYNIAFQARTSALSQTIDVGRADDGSTETACLSGASVTTTITAYNCTFTTGSTISTTAYFYIEQTAANNRNIHVDDVYIQESGARSMQQVGQLTLSSAITSALTLQNTNDSTTAFQIQNSAGTSDALVVDTLNNLFTVGVDAIFNDGVSVQTGSAGSVGATITAATGQTADMFRIVDEYGDDLLNVDPNAGFSINSSDGFTSTSAFTVSKLDTGVSTIIVGVNSSTPGLYTESTSFNLINTAATTINFGGAASTLNIGPTGATASSVNLAGGSGATGCTVDGATGDLSCSGALTTASNINLSNASPNINLTATDNTGELSINDASGNVLFTLKDLSTNFGAYAETGAFISRNSLFQEEFQGDKTDITAARAAGITTNAASSWGDAFYWSTFEVATTGDCTYSVVDDAINGIGRIQNNDASTGCTAFTGSPASTTAPHVIFDADNLPVMIMKVRPSNVGANDDLWVGMGYQSGDTVANDLNPPTEGIFFTNNDGTTWTGVTRSASTSNPVACSGQTVSTTQYALLKIEVVSTTSVRFYVDADVSDGIQWVSCGTSTTNIPTATLAGFMKFGSTSNTRNLDIDFFRIWQDDNIQSDNGLSAADNSLSENPIEISAEQEEAYDSRSVLADLMLCEDDTCAVSMDNGSLYAGLEVVTPTLLADSVQTNTISPVDSDIVLDLGADGNFVVKDGSGQEVLSFDSQGNARFSGTITADKIKANQIEGLDMTTNQPQQVDQNNSSGTPDNSSDLSTTIGSMKVEYMKVDLNLDVSGSLFVAGGLTIDGPAVFNGTTVFNKLAKFVDQAVFGKEVRFEDTVKFNNNTGGFAVIEAGQTQLRIKFTQPYDSEPVVNLSVKNGQFVDYAYKDLGRDGFTIVLKQATSTDTEFSWTAINVDNARTITRWPEGILSNATAN